MAQYAKYLSHEHIYIDITDSITKYFDNLSKVEKGLGYLLAKEEFFKHAIYEPIICKTYQNIVICSESDKRYLVEKYDCPKNHITVLENGIDLSIWKDIEISKETGIRNRLVFLGVMNVQTNALSVEYFLQDVFCNLSEEYHFTVIGPKPGKNLIAHQSERVHFTGHVQDLQSALIQHDIFVCPIVSGSGVKNKILQAALSNLPIISSPLGVDGINEEVKKHIFIANSPQEYYAHINTINSMTSFDLKKLIIAQQESVKEHYDINRLVGGFIVNNTQYA